MAAADDPPVRSRAEILAALVIVDHPDRLVPADELRDLLGRALRDGFGSLDGLRGPHATCSPLRSSACSNGQRRRWERWRAERAARDAAA
jgi:hypothetical protein